MPAASDSSILVDSNPALSKKNRKRKSQHRCGILLPSVIVMVFGAGSGPMTAPLDEPEYDTEGEPDPPEPELEEPVLGVDTAAAANIAKFVSLELPPLPPPLPLPLPLPCRSSFDLEDDI